MFGMKEVKAVVGAYSCDGGMAKIRLGREKANGEKHWIELRLGLVQIPVALDESNGGEIFYMCASSNMAVYAMYRKS